MIIFNPLGHYCTQSLQDLNTNKNKTPNVMHINRVDTAHSTNMWNQPIWTVKWACIPCASQQYEIYTSIHINPSFDVPKFDLQISYINTTSNPNQSTERYGTSSSKWVPNEQQFVPKWATRGRTCTKAIKSNNNRFAQLTMLRFRWLLRSVTVNHVAAGHWTYDSMFTATSFMNILQETCQFFRNPNKQYMIGMSCIVCVPSAK